MSSSFELFLAYVVGYTALFAPILGFLALGLFVAGLGLWRPRYLLYLYLLPFFFFAASSYGALEQTRTIWSRGTGQLYLPIVVWGLIGFYGVALLSDQYARAKVERTALHPWFYAFAALLGAHLLAAAWLGESLFWAAHSNGFRELVLAGLCFAFVSRVIRDEVGARQLVAIFVACVVARGIYGMVRFLFFGGDPANVYSNVERINVRLSFFDINDSLLASVTLFIVAWGLLTSWQDWPIWKRLGAIVVVVLELAVIVLSYRRTAWAGLVLAGVLFVAALPPGKRFLALIVAAPPMLLAIVYASVKRLGSGRSFLDGLLRDLTSGNPLEMSQRSYELVLAWKTFLDHPLFGVGSWGVFHRGFALIDWQYGDNAFSFLHSSVLQIMVKAGTVGLLLFAGLTLAFWLFIWRERGNVVGLWRGVYFAGAAGFLFLVPSWALGTPLVELRTMQLWAVCLALPFIAVRASRNAIARTA